MPRVDLIVESKVSRSPRARQLEGMFDVPATERSKLEWHGELPIDKRDWNVGLIVGPSGCGKSTILRGLFGAPPDLKWGAASVIDDFDKALTMEDISSMCQSVGFNTIPAWLRPFEVLSNGERFRVDLARRLLEIQGVIAVDEFTSVVDRQVAKIGSHAVQKAVRKRGRQMVAASCHYDIIDWLQPDWVLEPATMSFQWRSLQRRPPMECVIARVPYRAWQIFSPFHYMTAELHHGAQLFGAFVEGNLAGIYATMHMPHPSVKDIKFCSRHVVLPDWQGCGIGLYLAHTVASMFKAAGYRFRGYPAHPSLIRAYDRSPIWTMIKKPGRFEAVNRGSSTTGHLGGRPCAVIEYVGPPFPDAALARAMIAERFN